MNMIKKTSILLKIYKNPIWDLLSFLDLNKSKKLKVFKKTILKIYKKTTNNKLNDPVNLNIYRIVAKEISKNINKKTIKNLDFIESKSKENITSFKTEDFNEIESIKLFFSNITNEEILLLCLLNRHNFNIKECSYILNKDTNSLLSFYTRAKEKISKELIFKKKKTETKNNSLEKSKDCFFVENQEALFQNKILNKEEEKNIKDHIEKCSYCKNIYKWHNFINKKIKEEKTEPIIKNINNLVFKYISKRNHNLNLMHFIKKRFTGKIILFLALIFIIIFILKTFKTL